VCDRHIHNDRAIRSVSSRLLACPSYSSRVGFSVRPLQHRFGFLRLLVFPKANFTFEIEEFFNATVLLAFFSINTTPQISKLPLCTSTLNLQGDITNHFPLVVGRKNKLLHFHWLNNLKFSAISLNVRGEKRPKLSRNSPISSP
jgi:hypothetical protein